MKLNLTVFCWNLGRPCQNLQSWFSEKVYLSQGAYKLPDLNDDLGQSFVISGGTQVSTVELFSPDKLLTNCQCSLPSLPGGRETHTMNGLTVCGGGSVTGSNKCLTLGPRGWETSHILSQRRSGHVSWRRENGILLIGGRTAETQKTTEMAGQDGSVNGPFNLKHGRK